MQQEDKNISFFKGPIGNIKPFCNMSLQRVYELITCNEYKEVTEQLRETLDEEEQKRLKEKLDYVTFSGTFSTRANKNLIQQSGYICFDFDNLEEPCYLKKQLLGDDYISTALLFYSPRGKGLKWVIKIEKDKHSEYFAAVSKYVKLKYGVEADKQAREVSRACFICHDPEAYIYDPNDGLGVWSIEGLQDWLEENDTAHHCGLASHFVQSTSDPQSQTNNLRKSDQSASSACQITDIELITQKIEQAQVDITESAYDTWIKIGFALSHELEEDGRPYFHRLSRFSKKYDKDKQKKNG